MWDNKIKAVNSERVELGRILPLAMPFTLHICPTTYCDFRCVYCAHSLTNDEQEKIIGPKMHMSLDVFKKTIDGLSPFAQKLKCIIFSSIGEPLLNSRLPEMIRYAASNNVTERIEVITNAHTLTQEKSDALIESGITKLRISVQGLNAQKYKEISDVDIDFEKYLEQIKYFYQRKKGYNCTVFTKIIDFALVDSTEKSFYDIFEPISDEMYVEHLFKHQSDISKFAAKVTDNKNGLEVSDVNICPFPFYSISVYADGTIHNCHEVKFSYVGNVANMSLFDAWNSNKAKDFLINQLNNVPARCYTCTYKKGLIKMHDNIDSYKEIIFNKLVAKKVCFKGGC